MIIVSCKRHPRYKALRPPRCKCVACRKMWELAYFANVNTCYTLRVTQ